MSKTASYPDGGIISDSQWPGPLLDLNAKILEGKRDEKEILNESERAGVKVLNQEEIM